MKNISKRLVISVIGAVLALFTILMLLSGAVMVTYEGIDTTSVSYFGLLQYLGNIALWDPAAEGVSALTGWVALITLLYSIFMIALYILNIFFEMP